MEIRLKAINDDMWKIAENGYTIETPGFPTPLEKKLVQLNAQAKVVICNFLSRTQFIRFGRFESAKEIWDNIEKVYEGAPNQNEARNIMLRSMFTHFKRLRNESSLETFDRLSSNVHRLQDLGTENISDHDVVKKLL